MAARLTPRGDVWTAEEKNLLREKWHDCSGTEIATMLGRTRNGIIGQAKRLGLLGKEKSEIFYRKQGIVRSKGNARGRPWLNRVFIPRPAKSVAKPLARPKYEPVPVSGILLLDVGLDQCRAIIGKNSGGFTLVCGQQTEANKSFCPTHQEKFYVKVPPRRDVPFPLRYHGTTT